jgi:hypothetical protein
MYTKVNVVGSSIVQRVHRIREQTPISYAIFQCNCNSPADAIKDKNGKR